MHLNLAEIFGSERNIPCPAAGVLGSPPLQFNAPMQWR
jgi:hypothetical protein